MEAVSSLFFPFKKHLLDKEIYKQYFPLELKARGAGENPQVIEENVPEWLRQYPYTRADIITKSPWNSFPMRLALAWESPYTALQEAFPPP